MSSMWTFLRKLAAGEGADKAWLDAVVDDFAYLFNRLGMGAVASLPNASFENDTDADGIPDGWAVTLLQNGACGLTDGSFHGAKAYSFTRIAGANNGGGVLEAADYLPCSEGRVTISAVYSATAALKSKLEVSFFTREKNPISTVTQTITEKTCRKSYSFTFAAPALARFYKVKITGGATDTDVAGTCVFDAVSVSAGLYDYSLELPFNAAAPGGTGVWYVAATVTVLIPEDAATLKLKYKITETGTGSLESRLSLGGNFSASSGVVSNSSATPTLSVTVPAGLKGTLATLDIQTRRNTAEAVGSVEWTSTITNGREANITIEP